MEKYSGIPKDKIAHCGACTEINLKKDFTQGYDKNTLITSLEALGVKFSVDDDEKKPKIELSNVPEIQKARVKSLVDNHFVDHDELKWK